jgi:hypothetical protein
LVDRCIDGHPKSMGSTPHNLVEHDLPSCRAIIDKRNTHMTLRTDKFDQTNLAPFFAGEGLPRAWTGSHVGRRLTEGFAVSVRMPLGAHTGCYRRPCLPIVHEADDLDGQKEQRALERAMNMQDRVSIVLSSEEISYCDETLYWPMKYLYGELQLAKAVNRVAAAYAHDRDADWVAAKHGGTAADWLARHDEGCRRIAAGLIKDRVTVF